ncbi:hypothetical protein INT45_012401 [Circinella minor]|uniref:Inositol phospholipid synthesis and fat-storage-inducing TM-domain-containing protein n=1 Tax=Circinella minor TaxID=1195481 RepID=A0A8H7S382_9FUNG|nr:hypothetical protein INT45_012401 [Circinella minor]
MLRPGTESAATADNNSNNTNTPINTNTTTQNTINNYINNNPYLSKVIVTIQSLQPHQQFAVLFYILTVLISFIYSCLFTPPSNYFTNKRNLVNVLFVKMGWFWVTVVYMTYLYFIQSKKQSYERGLARYGLITMYWYILTQWLFGPSFIDRVFVATGGSCTDLLAENNIIGAYGYGACKRAGGNWGGGHDVSGHCVLLILSSLFLWEEVVAWGFYSIPTIQRIKANNTNRYGWWSVLAVYGLLLLWWWMLTITSAYFHGYFELLSGCFFGILGWAVVYIGILPQFPQIGLPPVQL